ncbi:MAG TPA: prolyl oligopeptidase family serine peptidase [Bryobacteraceae bacterium]|nr:prolyl oligopeptidase family serine peptidase [Bryobacteraceae bacterium]
MFTEEITMLSSGLTRNFIWLILLLLAISTSAIADTTSYRGTLPDGATYLIEVPSPWNGTLLLYSHGYVSPGSSNPAHDVGDPATQAFLLANGFALAGSSYAHTGWAIQEALPDQIAVLDAFASLVGSPTRTIAWGHSLGGIITAGLIQSFPERFDGALPMCGVLSGGVGTWNQALDSAFAFKTLLDSGDSLQLVNITNPSANLALAESILSAAQATPQGRARLALSFALGDLPGWFDPASPEPASTDFASREANQFLWAQQVDFPFVFALRAELEFRAGGNPSWNTDVKYKVQLRHSVDKDEVEALYAEAGLELKADLETLNNAERIAANPASVQYLENNIIFNGHIRFPVLTMHTSGDGLVSNQNESAYADVVREARENRLLRRTFIHRAGHCTFTPAETLTALQELLQRLDSGVWPDLDPATLNAEATALGPQLNSAPPSFFDFSPAKFLRPFDAFDASSLPQGRASNPGTTTLDSEEDGSK